MNLLRVLGHTNPPITLIVARNDIVSRMFSQSFWRLEQNSFIPGADGIVSRGRACERINPGYYFRATTPSLCRRYTLYRFRWVRDSARFADARTSCDPIAGAFWSGPSYCLFCCARSAAANAAPGMQVSSFAQDESRIQKSSPPEKLTRSDLAMS
jgi:hypothetical protein